MKRFISVLCVLVVLALSVLPLVSCGDGDATVLNVYNWGEYISDGSEDSLDVNAAFEEYYFELTGKKVKVNYTTYASNEDMYAKLRSGSTSYDVIIPSEYMIERMINENMLEPINFENVPNFEYIDDNFKNLFYDPENLYSIPYTYGMVGIIYNKTMVDEKDTGSWSLLWNEKYKGKILQFNNARDAFGTAMYYQHIDVNTTDRADWEAAVELLKAQKPIVQGYVMDEIFNKMKGGSAAIAPYYAGDFLTMYWEEFEVTEEMEDLSAEELEEMHHLAFFYPEEGTNVFVDAFCIPKCTRNKELAEAYINFMLSEEPAVANAEYIGYACPNTIVRENEEYAEYLEEIHPDAYDILYPEGDTVFTSYYHTLSDETQAIENELWEALKIESSVGNGIYTFAIVIVAITVLFFLWRWILHKKRSHY